MSEKRFEKMVMLARREASPVADVADEVMRTISTVAPAARELSFLGWMAVASGTAAVAVFLSTLPFFHEWIISDVLDVLAKTVLYRVINC